MRGGEMWIVDAAIRNDASREKGINRSMSFWFYSFLFCPSDEQVPVSVPGNGPFDQQKILIFLDLNNAEVLHCHLTIAVLAGHTSAFYGMLWIATADGPAVTEIFMSPVGHGRSAEMVALDYSGESSTFRSPYNIDNISDIEYVYIYSLS